MRIGYCSPFNPMKSGISDFSEELVPMLGREMETVLFTPVPMSNHALAESMETHPIGELDNNKLRSTLDLIVYHVGNNLSCHEEILKMFRKYPGVLELHDVGLHYLAAEKASRDQNWEDYQKLAKYCHGSRGEAVVEAFLRGETGAPWENHPIDMAMNRRVIEQATAVIVHSDFARQMVLGVRDDMPIQVIPLHCERIDVSPEEYRRNCRDELGIPEDALVFGSFGFASEPKRIIPILQAVSRCKKAGCRKMTYLIVGQAAENLHLEERLARLDIRNNVVLTGYTTLREYTRYMGACDFCFNLRYPTQGESSASLHRMLGMGKPVAVTGVGTFSEYPEDAVLKVRYDEHETDDIEKVIRLFAENAVEREKRADAALRYAVENCDIEKNAKRYAAFFRQVAEGTWQPEWEDVMIGRLCELGLTEKEYTGHVYSTILPSMLEC